MKKIFILVVIVFAVGAFFARNMFQTNAMNNSYRQITQEEASQIMKNEKDYIILDVRSKAEYEEGHIKGAISLPNENIGATDIVELPNKEQMILVYCRSGNRSRQAAKKLADKGYTNVLEFGGISTWKGEIVK